MILALRGNRSLKVTGTHVHRHNLLLQQFLL